MSRQAGLQLTALPLRFIDVLDDTLAHPLCQYNLRHLPD